MKLQIWQELARKFLVGFLVVQLGAVVVVPVNAQAAPHPDCTGDTGVLEVDASDGVVSFCTPAIDHLGNVWPPEGSPMACSVFEVIDGLKGDVIGTRPNLGPSNRVDITFPNFRFDKDLGFNCEGSGDTGEDSRTVRFSFLDGDPGPGYFLP